jgi:GTP cyclohydrolase I
MMAHARGEVVKAEAVADWLSDPGNEMATPHAQRSVARLAAEIDLGQFTQGFGKNEVVALIDLAEAALGTPVQSAVKRVDEQEFARLNGENTMFCEDAARRLRSAFELSHFLDYEIYVEHQESLHPHMAVAKVVKGKPGGFRV